MEDTTKHKQAQPAYLQLLERRQLPSTAMQNITAWIDCGREALIASAAGDIAASMAALAATEDIRSAIAGCAPAVDLLMKAQNNAYGFKTDQANGYPAQVVVGCFVSAALAGLKPCGNQWNIISGQMYITRGGLEYLLKRKGAQVITTPGIPTESRRMQGLPGKPDKVYFKAPIKLEWTENNRRQRQELEFEILCNGGMGVDAILGKATRKALMWLWQRLDAVGFGMVEGDADADDVIDMVPSTGQIIAQNITKASPAAEAVDDDFAEYGQALIQAQLNKRGLNVSAAVVIERAAAAGMPCRTDNDINAILLQLEDLAR